MKKLVTCMVIAGMLSACATTGDSAAKTAAAIKQACDGAEVVVAVLDPWAEAGQIKGKSLQTFEGAKAALFGPTGLCVSPPAGNLPAILVRISSFALTLAVIRRDAKGA